MSNDSSTQPFTIYFHLTPSKKPCQVCNSRENTTAYQFISAQGVVCPACLSKLLEDVRKVLQVERIDTFSIDLLTGETRQINHSLPTEVEAFNALLGGLEIDI